MKKSKLLELTLYPDPKGNHKSSTNESFELNIPENSTLSNEIDFPIDGCQIDIFYHAKDVSKS